MTRSRLDAALVARGLARSRARAGELIRDGVVLVDEQVVGKPSHQISDTAVITLTREVDHWVGRAALKLLRALELWPIDVAGRRCLDVGASTGGFTQVLLEQGASQVTALDVGHGQLAELLARDPRVVDLQGTNIRDVDAVSLGGPFDLVVCDLSFISLTVALPAIRPLVADGGDLVVLVKPQFEVGREQLGRQRRRHARPTSGVASCAPSTRRRRDSASASVRRPPARSGAGRATLSFSCGSSHASLISAGLSADDMLEADRPPGGGPVTRRILLVAHPRRPEALTVAKGVVDRLTHLGIDVSLQADEAKALDLKHSTRVHIATERVRKSRSPRGATSSSSSAETGRSCAAPSSPAASTSPCSASTSDTSASSPRRSVTTSTPRSSTSPTATTPSRSA